MEGRDLFFYGWVIFGVLAIIQFVVLAVPKIKEVHALGDSSLWYKDSLITHKVAELLVWIPFYFIILYTISRPAIWVEKFIDHTGTYMLLGGLIAFYSFFDARKKHWWAYPILILGLWGIFGGWLARYFILPFATG